MMGRQTTDQARLFYAFNLEDRVPPNHLLRRMNGIVGEVLVGIHEELELYYSHTGRPSIDPELMIRMLIVGYCYGIRSERQLCEQVALNLAYRWFCRLDLDDEVPDHSTFSKNRHGRFRESDLLRHVFERVVATCITAGLVKGEGFAVDASVMEADASRYHGEAPDEIDWSDPRRQTRAVREYLEALDPEPDPERKPPKVISPSDPASAWTAKANKRVQFGYGLNYLIDNENAIIVDVEATPARTYDEVASTKTMIMRTADRLGLKPSRLAADTAYGTGKFLAWLLERDIAPHIPVWERRDKDDKFPRSAFVYDREREIYVCPNGKPLRTAGTIHDGRVRNYLASLSDCRVCPLKQKCTPAPFRKIARDINEDAREHARALAETPGFEQSSKERKKVEMRFGHLKTHHRFERMRLRGLSGARDEFHLAAIVQNLKTMALRPTSHERMAMA
jgi:transposase